MPDWCSAHSSGPLWAGGGVARHAGSTQPLCFMEAEAGSRAGGAVEPGCQGQEGPGEAVEAGRQGQEGPVSRPPSGVPMARCPQQALLLQLRPVQGCGGWTFQGPCGPRRGSPQNTAWQGCCCFCLQGHLKGRVSVPPCSQVLGVESSSPFPRASPGLCQAAGVPCWGGLEPLLPQALRSGHSLERRPSRARFSFSRLLGGGWLGVFSPFFTD